MRFLLIVGAVLIAVLVPRHGMAFDAMFEVVDGNGGDVAAQRQRSATYSDAYGLHVYYTQTSTGILRHAWRSGATWYFENFDGHQVDGQGRVNGAMVGPTGIVHNGTQHLFYEHLATGGGLRHAWWGGTQWYYQTLDPAGRGGISTVSRGDILHVFYLDIDGHLRHAWAPNWGNWAFEVLDGAGGGAGRVASQFAGDTTSVVHTDPYDANVLHVFYYDAIGRDLRHAHWRDSLWSWNFEILDGNGSVNPVERIGADVGRSVAALSSAALGLQVLYADGTNGDLRHAWSWAGSWNYETLDGAGGLNGRTKNTIASSSRIALLECQGILQVMYYDATSQDLRRAWFDVSGWEWRFHVLDGLGNTGLNPSGTATGYSAEIFYYDGSRVDLRRATIGCPCRQAPANAIVEENCKPGAAKLEWDLPEANDGSIEGFASDISVAPGGRIEFKIRTSTYYRIDIYRLGYYSGDGARKVATVWPLFTGTQPPCNIDPAVGLFDCSNWTVSANWNVPSDATSGVYLARMVRLVDGTEVILGVGHIIFVVRDGSARLSAIAFQTADSTWQAYNNYGDDRLKSDLYTITGSAVPDGARQVTVSYNRPFGTRDVWPANFFFGAEYPFVRWLERNGYDVGYIAGSDTFRHGDVLSGRRLFLSVGHDEYWSAEQRAAVEAARNSGVNLAFFSGNEVFWKTRWDSTSHPRMLISYKGDGDPSGTWTGLWRDPRGASLGGRPENALTGTYFRVNGIRRDDRLSVSPDFAVLRLWRNTMIERGEPYQSAPGILGYEWDTDVDNCLNGTCFRPPGLVRHSRQSVAVTSQLVEDLPGGGVSLVGQGVATHSLVSYRHASGARVFGAGTVAWSWGLDACHDGVAAGEAALREKCGPPSGNPAEDPVLQQATINLFADMGLQPATLQPGLVPAAASDDETTPVSAFLFPASGATIPLNTEVIVRCEAQDFGGIVRAGNVAAVEFSFDAGTSWHPGERSTDGAWQAAWRPSVPGNATVRCRAADDSNNLEISGSSVSVTVQ